MSELYTIDAGIQVTAYITDHFSVDAGYHRYEMRGLDQTTPDMYPEANIYTVGVSVTW